MATQKRGRISRRLPAQWKAPVKAHATLVGEVIWAHNFAQNAFCTLFAVIVSPAPTMDIGIALWHVLSSDRAQLDLLTAAAGASIKLTKRKRLLRSILWAVEKGQKLREFRNDAAHTPTAWLGHELIPHPISTKPKRYKKLTTRDFVRTFRLLKGDLYQLGLYVHALEGEVCFPGMFGSLPQRPRLRSIQQ